MDPQPKPDTHVFLDMTPMSHTPERWKGIIQCKKDFLEKGIDPTVSPYVSQEVANSWIRSRNYGLTAESMLAAPSITAIELESLYLENSDLISIALPLIDSYKPLLTESGYIVSLTNDRGVILYRSGNTTLVDRFGDHVALGTIWNESTIGTCAHVLSMIHQKPMTLLGPENFPSILQSDISSAAPIFDSTGNTIAVLTLVQKLGEDPWQEDYHKLQLHTLGWVTSMAMAIKSQLNLKYNTMKYESTNTALQTAIKLLTEGIIIISAEGTIQHINALATQVIDEDAESAIGKNIREYLVKDNPLDDLLRKNQYIEAVDIGVRKADGYQTYRFTIQPFSSDQQTGGIVIRINNLEKTDRVVSAGTGSKTIFDFDSIKGESTQIAQTRDLAKRFASSTANILILGESGTGKELFAQAIHNYIAPTGPFIVLNCAAIPNNLIESELFGYESGAFTGAKKYGNPGKIELAQGGTLFLDEIGEMPVELQTVLLRVLEDKQVIRIGGNKYRTVDFRLIAATNKDLESMIHTHQFRQDLYYRLSVLKIKIPSLCNRGVDVIFLAKYFIIKHCRTGKLPQLSTDTEVELLRYAWPGNVRQLESAIIYALSISDGDVILPKHLPEEILNNHPVQNQYEKTLVSYEKQVGTNSVPIEELSHVLSIKEAERIVMMNALKKADKDICIAAKLLDVSKSTLYRKLKILGIDV
ncbi:sigma 54-interacting transcriptional regulator [Dehalobacter sp. DCM]|uniref:sigma-54-dependent Fis family transcriptional regulator n=1 Tax=Dehalobacter sp. DCM TaxID=2907827 RepID=UPI00308198F3|nr:sigma 54-interacting transcriptional regulator [Dehalobacter sp. DCM]